MKDASTYKRAGRPVYYISYYSVPKMKRVHEATTFRTDDPEGRRKAYELAQDKAKAAAAYKGNSDNERWETWVLPWLEKHYARQAKTLSRYKTSWRWVLLYLVEHKIPGPRALTFQQVHDYHEWRMNFKKRTGRTAGHNTAIADIKMLQVVMNEALRREWVVVNPCTALGIRRLRGKEKLEIPDDDMAYIIAEMDKRAAENPKGYQWLRTAWEIARWQGCRIGETRIELRRQVNLRDGLLTIYGKGRDGQPKVIETLIHPELRPLFEKMIAEKRQWTLELPKMYGRDCWRFFQSIGMPQYSFHCTRVTVITKGARAGVPEAQMMAYIGHGKSDVHRIYQKLKARDLTRATAAISYTPAKK